jgi:hypothetical protein
MTEQPVVLADDPDASWSFDVTDPDGNDLTFDPPMVAIGAGDYTVEAAWVGAPAPTRRLRIPLTGLTPGRRHTVYLKVPGGNDVQLGAVYVRQRT